MKRLETVFVESGYIVYGRYKKWLLHAKHFIIIARLWSIINTSKWCVVVSLKYNNHCCPVNHSSNLFSMNGHVSKIHEIYIYIYIYIFKVINELDTFGVTDSFLQSVVEGVGCNLQIETSPRETYIITTVYVIIKLYAKFR